MFEFIVLSKARSQDHMFQIADYEWMWKSVILFRGRCIDIVQEKCAISVGICKPKNTVLLSSENFIGAVALLHFSEPVLSYHSFIIFLREFCKIWEKLIEAMISKVKTIPPNCELLKY